MSAFGIIASNLTATKDLNNLRTNMNRKRKLCWACQKDKTVLGGHLDLRPGLAKFVCKECVALKKEKKP
jgi:hypothetical protein